MSPFAQAGDPDFLRGIESFFWAVGIASVLAVGLVCWLAAALIRFLQRRRCRSCQTTNDPEATYCYQCGSALTIKRAA